jgi:glyoxylase I family protein
MSPVALHHLAFRSEKLAQLEVFYTQLVGLRVLRRFANGHCWLGAGGCVIMLEQQAPGEHNLPSGSLELIAFQITQEAVPALRERLKQAQVAIEAETEFTLYVRDPDGRRIGFSHYNFADLR